MLTDFTMPEMTGLDLAKEILKIRPGLPVILCSGHTERFTKETTKELGIHFANKPLDRRSLAELIRQALDGSESNQTA